jgi:hypothetical protein
MLSAMLAVLCGLWIQPGSLFAASMDELVNRWRQPDYDGVLPLLVEYRKQSYGRNVQVDYMIATSLCRLDDDEALALGQKFFLRIMAAYELTRQNRRQIEREHRRCIETATTHQPPVVLAFSIGHSDVGVRGKTFYWLDQKNGPLGGDPIQTEREIAPEELASRRFTLTEREQALAKVGQLTGSRFKTIATEHFVIASASGQTRGELEAIGRHLDATMSFFHQAYGMPMPRYLVTIYLTPTTYELRELASQIHGLALGRGSIGYSFRDDYSIAGVVSGAHSGTLKHELFHLMARSHFGDIPPWLDEGMAALYEVSRRDGARIDGLQNWRGDVLRRFWDMHPEIDQLVRMDWSAFDAEGHSREQQAANHATARYFALFLQERGELAQVYRAFQQQEVADLSDDPGADASRLLHQTLAQSPAQLEQAFVVWFQALERPLGREVVRGVQQSLNDLGYDAGSVDGLMGSRTRRAVMAFQEREGLSENGKLDTTTLELLKARAAGSGL